MASKLTIVFVAAEVAPFAKAGGVADVVRALPKAIRRLGHNVLVVSPLHGSVDTKKHNLRKIAANVPVGIDETTTIPVDFWQGELMEGLPVYFIDNKKYFSGHIAIYGTSAQNTRYMVFDLAVFQLLNFLRVAPTIIHCNDWQTGLIPYFLETRFAGHSLFKKTRTLYTIHNLVFQFGRDWWKIPPEQRDDGRSPLPRFTNRTKIEHINFAKRALRTTDAINTVSATYAEEILTQDFGQDLHRTLGKRKDRLFGIVNGIDYYDYNPATDPGLYRNYDADSLNIKEKNKLFLQRELGLPEDPATPVIGMVSRLTEQKGFDLLLEIIEPLMRLDIHIAILGGGDRQYQQSLKNLARKHPKKLAGHFSFSADLATRFYAGSDMFLMPSRYEPCGLGQLISLRYGSVPIVHATGGLVDTVTDFNPKTGKGNGFVFKTYDSRDMLVAIVRAMEQHKRPDIWFPLMRRSMQQSYSWEIPARKYVALYRKTLTLDRQRNSDKATR